MAAPPAEPFFLDAAPGRRFCLYHPPAAGTACKGAILHIPPFAEEMNRSRRASALQAAAFAAAGYAVLRIDLFGTGDSDGDFSEARWDIWKNDLHAARAWLSREAAAPLMLWGVRTGALLALDLVRDIRDEVAAAILWQPVVKGDLFLTQFLRLRLAGDMLSGEHENGAGTLSMRDALSRGETLEIAGYGLAGPLATSLSATDASDHKDLPRRVEWIEAVSAAKLVLPPAVEKTARRWRDHGSDVRLHQAVCAPFWTSQENDSYDELIRVTLDCVEAPR